MFPVVNVACTDMMDLQTCSHLGQVPSVDNFVIDAAAKNDNRAIGPDATINYSTDMVLGGNKVLLYLMYSIVSDKCSKEWTVAFCNVIHNCNQVIDPKTFPETKAKFERKYREITNAFPENMGKSLDL